MPIEPKTFTAYLGPKPQIQTKSGPKSTGKVHDGDGLYLIIGGGTQRSWLYRYRFGGVNKELALGSAHKLGLKAARAKRAECEEMLEASVDPKAVKADAKAALAAAAQKADKRTVFELAKEAVTVIGPPTAKYHREWINRLKPELTAGLGAMIPRDVTRTDVVRCLEAIRERAPEGEMSRKVEGQLVRLFEWCAAPGRGYLPEDAVNPAVFKGRARSLIRKLEIRKVSHATIPWREIGAVVASMRAWGEDRGAPHALALEWLLLSAARAGTVLSADWREIDLKRLTWTVPAWKMKIKGVGEHVVPLSTRHVEILQAMIPGGDLKAAPVSGLVFPSALGGKEMDDSVLRQTLRRAYSGKLQRIDGSTRSASVHGLRGTFRTWAEMQTNPATGLRLYDDETLELCLAHVVGDSARRAYLHESNIAARRTVLNAWATFVSNPLADALAKAA